MAQAPVEYVRCFTFSPNPETTTAKPVYILIKKTSKLLITTANPNGTSLNGSAQVNNYQPNGYSQQNGLPKQRLSINGFGQQNGLPKQLLSINGYSQQNGLRKQLLSINVLIHTQITKECR